MRVATESTRRGRPAPGSTQPTGEGTVGRASALLGEGYYRASPRPNLATPWGREAQTPFPSFRPPPPPLPGKKAREPWRGDKRKDSTLGVRGGIGPFLLLALKPLAVHPPANPPTRPFKPFSSLLSSTPTRRLKVGGVRGGGKLKKRLGAKPKPQGPDQSTALAAPHPRPRAPSLSTPSQLPHLPCHSRGSRATSAALARPASARAPTSARAQPPSLAAHPLQSSFTKLSDFPKLKGEEVRNSSFPS